MSRLLKQKVLLAWIACLAIVFGSLAPSVSHAMMDSPAAPGLIEICTIDGVKSVSANTDFEKSLADLAAHGFEHCPFCLTHGGSFALLPPSSVTFAVLGGHDVFPSLFYQAPRPLFTWADANPRAPPAAL